MGKYTEEFSKSFDFTMGFVGWSMGILTPFIILAALILVVLFVWWILFVRKSDV